jgi:hypothetical protein
VNTHGTVATFETTAEWAERNHYTIRQAQRIAAQIESKGLAKRVRLDTGGKPRWMIWEGYKTSPVDREWVRQRMKAQGIDESLSGIATGRGRILQRWRRAIDRAKKSGKHVDAATREFLRLLAATGTLVSKSTLYNWWKGYLAQGVDGLIDGRAGGRAGEASKAIQAETPAEIRALTVHLPGNVAVKLHLASGTLVRIAEGDSGVEISLSRVALNNRAEGASKAT